MIIHAIAGACSITEPYFPVILSAFMLGKIWFNSSTTMPGLMQSLTWINLGEIV